MYPEAELMDEQKKIRFGLSFLLNNRNFYSNLFIKLNVC